MTAITSTPVPTAASGASAIGTTVADLTRVLTGFGQGTGMWGLPGDFTPPSRRLPPFPCARIGVSRCVSCWLPTSSKGPCRP